MGNQIVSFLKPVKNEFMWECKPVRDTTEEHYLESKLTGPVDGELLGGTLHIHVPKTPYGGIWIHIHKPNGILFFPLERRVENYQELCNYLECNEFYPPPEKIMTGLIEKNMGSQTYWLQLLGKH